MTTRIQEALAARREQLTEGEKGFTLIELLVVVIIIGILAAIAIPVYIGVQNNATNASMTSDLTNAKVAVVGYYTDKGSSAAAPALTVAVLGKYGFAITSTNTMAFKGTPTSTTFCIDGTSSTTGKFFVDQSNGAKAGSCP
jgi:prepilin-type N-terminal cleavage/methylation domain-containing protein